MQSIDKIFCADCLGPVEETFCILSIQNIFSKANFYLACAKLFSLVACFMAKTSAII